MSRSRMWIEVCKICINDSVTMTFSHTFCMRKFEPVLIRCHLLQFVVVMGRFCHVLLEIKLFVKQDLTLEASYF